MHNRGTLKDASRHVDATVDSVNYPKKLLNEQGIKAK